MACYGACVWGVVNKNKEKNRQERNKNPPPSSPSWIFSDYGLSLTGGDLPMAMLQIIPAIAIGQRCSAVASPAAPAG
jgi:hypothetical protein